MAFVDALQRISDASKDAVRDEVENTFATYAIVNEMKRKFPGLPEDYLETKVENAVKLGGYATSAINYGYNVYENHQEFKNFHNALQADAWDTLPITTGAMIGLMDSTQTFPTNPMTKVTLATLASILVTITVDKSKEDLKVEDKIKDENDLHEGN